MPTITPLSPRLPRREVERCVEYWLCLSFDRAARCSGDYLHCQLGCVDHGDRLRRLGRIVHVTVIASEGACNRGCCVGVSALDDVGPS